MTHVGSRFGLEPRASHAMAALLLLCWPLHVVTAAPAIPPFTPANRTAICFSSVYWNGDDCGAGVFHSVCSRHDYACTDYLQSERPSEERPNKATMTNLKNALLSNAGLFWLNAHGQYASGRISIEPYSDMGKAQEAYNDYIAAGAFSSLQISVAGPEEGAWWVASRIHKLASETSASDGRRKCGTV